MTSLKFSVPGIDRFSRSTHVPVDVHRRDDFALIGSVASDESLSLEPGAYVAVVRLPFGEFVGEEFTLSVSGEPASRTVSLSGVPTILREHLGVPTQAVASRWSSELRPGWLAFNPFNGELFWAGDSNVAGVLPGTLSFVGLTDGRARFFALIPKMDRKNAANLSTYLIAVPASPYQSMGLDVTLRADGRPAVRANWQNHTATILLEYIKMGATSSASSLARTSEISAMELVSKKASDPLAGALGLYVLLSQNALEQIGRRCENLFKFNEWSADGSVIFAEYLARIGEHQKARDTLLTLESRGLPAFSMGIRIGLSLFDKYLGSDTYGPEEKKANFLFENLKVWAEHTVFEEAITTVEVDARWDERIRAAVPIRSV